MICQLLETEAAACGVGLCQMGGLDFEPVRALFQLGPNHELLHSLVGGAASHPGVRAAVAPATRSSEAAEEHVRRFLRGKLPEYMVPPTYVFLDALPLSSNGKVDRKALPAIARHAPARHSQSATPASEVERLIARAWKEVLGIEEVGLDDNFFDRGGTSVQMVQLHAQLRGRLGHDLALVDMFVKYPTVRSLAATFSEAATPQGTPPGTPRQRPSDDLRRRLRQARQAQRAMGGGRRD